MELIEKLIIAILVVIAGCVLAFPVFIYRSAKSTSFELQKSEWVCTKTEPREVRTTMVVGKVLIPRTDTRNVCVQYSERRT